MKERVPCHKRRNTKLFDREVVLANTFQNVAAILKVAGRGEPTHTT